MIFGSMFETLADYKYVDHFSDQTAVPATVVNDILSLNLFKSGCSCRWCLGHSGNTGTNCTPTASGCGFLWMQECNQCILCL
jgi:hypothetical protein